MDEYEGLSHSKWECKCHVVFIPKCRRRTLYQQLRKYLGEIFRIRAAKRFCAECSSREAFPRSVKRAGRSNELRLACFAEFLSDALANE